MARNARRGGSQGGVGVQFNNGAGVGSPPTSTVDISTFLMWIGGGLAALVILIGGYTIDRLYNQVDGLDDRLRAIEKEGVRLEKIPERVNQLSNDLEHRAKALEEQLEVIRQQIHSAPASRPSKKQ